MSDPIDRQMAISALRYAQHKFVVADEAGGLGTVKWSENVIYLDAAIRVLDDLPSAQPEHLRDDDFEAIRIHLNAYKERLCNQHRYAEAEEYQQLIDRFMSFAEAQPQIIRCKDCRYWQDNNGGYPHDECRWNKDETPDEDDYCSYAERREVDE